MMIVGSLAAKMPRLVPAHSLSLSRITTTIDGRVDSRRPMAGALTERWRRRHWQLAAAAVVVIIVVCMSYVTRRRRRRPWPMLLISRPFPPKFSKPPKKSSSTRFFCSTKNIFRRAVCRRQSRFFRVLITPNPVFSTQKVCVQRHPKYGSTSVGVDHRT